MNVKSKKKWVGALSDLDFSNKTEVETGGKCWLKMHTNEKSISVRVKHQRNCLLLMGTKWGRNNTASFGQPLMMGINMTGHLSDMESLRDCTYVLLRALGRPASSLHAHSVASIVDIPSISHWQNGPLSWITSLWEALIGSLIQCPRREKGPLVARHSSAY